MTNRFRSNGKLVKRNELDNTLLVNIIGTFLIRGGALIITIVSMPIYIRFFDSSKVLGLWFTLLSVMTWILSCDLGIGNGLRNNLVEALVNDDITCMKQYIVSAYVISTIAALLVGGIGYWLIGSFDWNLFFNISEQVLPAQALRFSIRAIFISVIIQFVLKLITSILYALQKSAMTNLIALISSITQVAIVLGISSQNPGQNLVILSLVYGCCTNIPLLIATFFVFTKKLHLGRLRLKDFKFDFSINILSLGGTFFLVQLLFMAITNTNEIIITKLYGSENVVEYQIYNKIFTIVGSLFMIALTPLWSAITQAYNKRDEKWLRGVYKKLNFIVCLAVVSELGIALLIKPIVFLWVGSEVLTVRYDIAFAFAIFGGIYIYQSALSTIACGIGKLKTQTYCYAIAVILKVILVSIAYSQGLSWSSLIIINIIILLPYCSLQPKAIIGNLRNLSD